MRCLPSSLSSNSYRLLTALVDGVKRFYKVKNCVTDIDPEREKEEEEKAESQNIRANVLLNRTRETVNQKYTQTVDRRRQLSTGYPVMTRALMKSAFPIFFLLCECLMSRSEVNEVYAELARPGGRNDPDMLEAPILLGCDVRNRTKDAMNIVANKVVIAVNQVSHDVAARGVGKHGEVEEVRRKLLNNGFLGHQFPL
ncbi:hypothetical protein Q3G72_002183 [Acer saccharum]|nr:hypothetical protein Q3G72_002183 [Acer saccharum]